MSCVHQNEIPLGVYSLEMFALTVYYECILNALIQLETFGTCPRDVLMDMCAKTNGAKSTIDIVNPWVTGIDCKPRRLFLMRSLSLYNALMFLFSVFFGV